MKNKPLLFLLSVCGLLAISARGENPPAKVIFEQYMNQAQTFADNYPREKAYLHFDNTSYYVGDTIWFKAYVTLAEKQVFSSISRPLYVELVDQAGHVTDKQIIKLSQGKATGSLYSPSQCYPVITKYVLTPAGCLHSVIRSTFHVLSLSISFLIATSWSVVSAPMS